MVDGDRPAEPAPFLFFSGTRGGLDAIGPPLASAVHFSTPKWIEPRRREPLSAYAARLAEQIDPGVPCIIGGLSFGGMVAMEVATHLDVRACVLVSSVRSPAEFPPWFRLARPLAIFGPEIVRPIARILEPSIVSLLPTAAAVPLRALTRSEGAFYRWANWAALSWQPTASVARVRSIHIHGDADKVFPIRYTRPDIVVPGADHSMALTHAEFLTATLTDIYHRASAL